MSGNLGCRRTMSDSNTPTPAQLGYRMPAEWEPHEATWIAWPHHEDDWPGKFDPIPWVYAEIVRHLSRAETVHIVVADGKMERRAAEHLERAGANAERVRFFRAKTDRVWLRDSGPAFLVREAASRGRGRAAGPDPPGRLEVQWLGQVREPQARQPTPAADRGPSGLHALAPARRAGGQARRVVMEGGAIDVNGRGPC